MRRLRMIRQHDSGDCAAAALAMVSLYYGKDVTITRLRELCGTDTRGTTIAGLCDGAETLGLRTVPVNVEYGEFLKGEFTLPAICMTVNADGQGHYVVISKVSEKRVVVYDPAFGKRRERPEAFGKEFCGRLVLAAPGDDFDTSMRENRHLLSRFLDILKPQKSLFAAAILSGLLLTLLGIALSLFYRFLIDDVIGNGMRDQVTTFFVAYLIVTLTNITLSALRQLVVIHLSQRISIPIALGYFGHILRLPMKFFGTRRRGDIITRYQDASTVVSVASDIILSVAIDIVFAAVSAAFLLMISPELFAFVALMTVLSAILVYVFLPAYKRLNRESMEAESRLNSQIIEGLSNVETIKAAAAEERVLESVETRYLDTLKIGYKGGILSNIQGTVSAIISSVISLFMMWYGVVAILDGKITLGTLMAFYSLSEFFMGPIGRLISLQLQIQEADVAMKRLGEIYEVKEEDEGREGAERPDTLYGDIELRGVTFRYGSRRPVLSGLDLTVRKGEALAIVGGSGSGKTTIGKVVAGLWMPENGEVRINGYDTRDMDISEARRKIAYVRQDTELFSGTIAENLRLSKPDATYREMRDACELADFMDVVKRSPSRFDTYLEEAGANLSGGERQRLALARAFLKHPEVMILDEATSNLDPVTERNVLDALDRTRGGRTTVVMAHRLSVAERCDRVVLLDRGRIVEDGTHEGLMAKGGEYAAIWAGRHRAEENRKEKPPEDPAEEAEPPGACMEY